MLSLKARKIYQDFSKWKLDNLYDVEDMKDYFDILISIRNSINKDIDEIILEHFTDD